MRLFDNLDLNRATDAFLNGIPIASMYAMKHGLLKHGPAITTAVLFEELMDSKALWLMPNTTSVYMASWLELGDEPMVMADIEYVYAAGRTGQHEPAYDEHGPRVCPLAIATADQDHSS